MSGFGTAAASCGRATTQLEVMNSIVEKLRLLDEFETESTCFLSDTPWPGIEVSDNLFCTVAPSSGSFESNLIEGSSQFGVLEISHVTVTVWSRMDLDRIEHSVSRFTHSARGVFPLKKKILQSLAGKMLVGSPDGNSILERPLTPIQSLHPPGKMDDFMSFAITFEACFWWDLE